MARRNGRRFPWTLALVVLVLGFIVGPLVLHLGQKRHNRLSIDLSTVSPQGSDEPRGEIFASTLAALVEHELSGLTGWRPNDFALWGHRLWADNNANRQLGIIQAVRESARVFKDHLTKVSSTTYDPNLVAAETAFRNDAEKFWLPSAESKFRQGVQSLTKYVDGLHGAAPTSKPMNHRVVELIRLLTAWTDLLGDAHANLFKHEEEDGSKTSMFRTDDYFYHAQGFAHVLHHLSRAIQREFAPELTDRPVVASLFEEVATALDRAATLKPLIVLDSSPEGLLANHRRNLDAFVVEARQKMYSIREELEK